MAQLSEGQAAPAEPLLASYTCPIQQECCLVKKCLILTKSRN